MKSKLQPKTSGQEFGAYGQDVTFENFPSGAQRSTSENTVGIGGSERTRQYSARSGFDRPSWSGDIMWTFAFGEKETCAIGRSVFSSGRQAWQLLNQMNDLCRDRQGTMLRSSSYLIPLASELRIMASECPEGHFFLELRVTQSSDGSPDLELMDKGLWRKPSLQMSMNSQPESMLIEAGD